VFSKQPQPFLVTEKIYHLLDLLQGLTLSIFTIHVVAFDVLTYLLDHSLLRKASCSQNGLFAAPQEYLRSVPYAKIYLIENIAATLVAVFVANNLTFIPL